jgi:PhnB protein
MPILTIRLGATCDTIVNERISFSMSQAKATPEGYHSVQPYLILKNCAAAIELYKHAFGATEKMRMPRPNGTIAHAEIHMGDSVVMLADENPEIGAWSIEHYGGSPVSLLIYVDDCDAVYKQALGAGASSLREPADQPYGDRMAGVKDPFGYQWWIAAQITEHTRGTSAS